MSNQRTTQLTRLYSNEIAPGDLIPIVDVSAYESGPTGEIKKVQAQDLGAWLANNAVNVSIPFQANQTSNGLWFDESVAPAGDPNKYCYTPYPALGSNFSLYVRGFVPSNIVNLESDDRVIFGAGPNLDQVGNAAEGNYAYIAIRNYDLVARVDDGVVGNEVVYPNFFDTINPNKVFGACLTKDSGGVLSLYVNGVLHATASAGPSSINNSYLVMGCGRAEVLKRNINCTVYEAHVFSDVLDATGSLQLFYGGSNTSSPAALSSYTPENLNPGPTQWLDSVGSHHLLLPTVGATPTNPNKKFNLLFSVDASGYLGDGSVRNILPNKYVLTSCIVESQYKPLVSVGSSDAVAPVSASGTGSWRDNRVPFTSASYGVNPLGLLSLGVAHADKTLYVAFSGSSYPCTFSFEGYVRN